MDSPSFDSDVSYLEESFQVSIGQDAFYSATEDESEYTFTNQKSVNVHSQVEENFNSEVGGESQNDFSSQQTISDNVFELDLKIDKSQPNDNNTFDFGSQDSKDKHEHLITNVLEDNIFASQPDDLLNFENLSEFASDIIGEFNNSFNESKFNSSQNLEKLNDFNFEESDGCSAKFQLAKKKVDLYFAINDQDDSEKDELEFEAIKDNNSTEDEFASVQNDKKEDWESSNSSDFDWNVTGVRNILAELISNCGDFDDIELESNIDLDDIPVLETLDKTKSTNITYLAERIAEAISKIFINSSDEDLRIEALQVADAKDCGDLCEKLTARLLTFLQIKKKERKSEKENIRKRKSN